MNTTIEIEIWKDVWMLYSDSKLTAYGHFEEGQTIVSYNKNDINEELLFTIIEATLNGEL